MTDRLSDRSGRSQLDLAELIDNSKIGRARAIMLGMVGLCLVMDGFDVQAMGYVAPALIADWGVPAADLGPVFGAALFGMLIGSLAFSVLGDRIGRRPVLIASTLVFALCMLATPLTHTVTQMLVMRFVTGLALGGVMPNAMSLAGEYSPSRIRVTVMMWIACGFTAGAVLGGLISIALIDNFGWHAVFYFGGAVPLVLAGMMYFILPESLQLMVLRGRKVERIQHWVHRIDPTVQISGDTKFRVHEKHQSGAPIAELFRDSRMVGTILLWVINFMNLLNLYFLSNWLPTIMTEAGYSRSTAVLAGTTLQLGGLIGTLVMGRIIDKVGFRRVLIPSFLLAAVTIALIGQTGVGIALTFVVVIVAGFCIVGGQPAVNALAATYYPTELRATGIGWSLGVGRIGSIIGPVLGGALIALQWSTSSLLLLAAIPAVVSSLMMVLWGMKKVTAASADEHEAARGVTGH